MSKDVLLVIDGDQQVPFLRGVVTHSLVAKGLSFEDAYRTAQEVRDEILPARRIDRRDLSKLIRKVVKRLFGKRYDLLSAPTATPLILVENEDSPFPFSKGVLSLSLQAAGVEPSLGYDIARDIERTLLQGGKRRIKRAELRRLTYEALLHTCDRRCAERYLLWRMFSLDPMAQDSRGKPERPLVILFGGATGTGKSSIAAEVAHRLGIRQVLSTDTVRQIMRTMFSHDLLPTIHSSSYLAWQDLPGANRDAVITAFSEQTVRVLVGVKAILERAATEKISLILEGVHLVPGLLPLEPFQNRIDIIPVVVSILNKRLHLKRFPARERQTENRQAEGYREHFKEIRLIQDYILEIAEEKEIPILENITLEETIAESLSVIAGRLLEKLKLSRDNLLKRALEPVG